MKVAEKKQRLNTDGFASTKKFDVQIDGFFFEQMYGGLYKDPIAAIIRELSTNAYDSHVQNGNPDEPFLIHMPNKSEPNFYIRDYGVGLAPSEMEGVYAVINKSTKRDTNEQAGCFGLGSKTPLAYSDSFIVESYQDGVKFIYSVFKDEEGVPTLAAINEQGIPTDEPNGLKIVMAVAEKDFIDFQNKAREIFEYFPVHPTIKGCSTFNEKRINYTFEGDGWRVREQKREDWNKQGCRIVMGPVYYPIRDMDTNDLTQVERAILNCSIDIFVDIGEVQMIPSRESLHFNPRTIRNIKARIEKVVEQFQLKVEDYFANCPTLWEARCKYKTMWDEFPRELLNAIDFSKVTYKGSPLFKSSYGHYNVEVDFYGKDWDNLDMKTFKWESRYSGGKTKQSAQNVLYPNDKIEFYEKDLKVGALTRCRNHVDANNDTVIVLVDFKGDAALKAKFLAHVGTTEANLKKSSTLAAKPKISTGVKKTTNKKKAKPVKVCSFNTSDKVYSKADYWTKELNVDLNAGGFYIELYRHDAQHGTRTFTPEQIRKLLKVLEFAGVPVTQLYGVRANIKKKVADMKQWVNIIDYAAKHLKTFTANYPFLQYVKLQRDIPALKKLLFTDFKSVQDICKLLPNDSSFLTMMTQIRKWELQAKQRGEKSQMVYEVFQFVYDETPEEDDNYNTFVKQYEKLERQLESMMKRLSLLGQISFYRVNRDPDLKKSCAEYIEFVESKEKK